MRFNAVAEYAPGKTLLVADTLSRSPLASMSKANETESDVAYCVDSVVGAIPASTSKMDKIRKATAADVELQLVMQLIKNGWPDHPQTVPSNPRAYFQVRSELPEYRGLVLRGSRSVGRDPTKDPRRAPGACLV